MGIKKNVIVIDNDKEMLSVTLPSRSLQAPSMENTRLKEQQHQTHESLPPTKPNNNKMQ